MKHILPGKYRHFKGKFYEVIGEAIHSETREEMVIYKPLYDCPELGKKPLFIRPKKMFMEKVLVNGKNVPRFKKVE